MALSDRAISQNFRFTASARSLASATGGFTILRRLAFPGCLIHEFVFLRLGHLSADPRTPPHGDALSLTTLSKSDRQGPVFHRLEHTRCRACLGVGAGVSRPSLRTVQEVFPHTALHSRWAYQAQQEWQRR